MVACKNCQDTHTVKNGFVRDKQRYKCKLCGYNFVLGDERYSHATEVKKALCIILYSLGKASFGFLAKLLGVHAPQRITGFDKRQPGRLNPRLLPIFKKSNLMRCGTLSNQKKKNLDYQSRGSSHRANHCLGTRWS